MAAAENGAKYTVGIVADQQEERFWIRFLDNLKQLVGGCLVDLFWQPDDHHALVTLVGFGGEDADDARCLGLVDLRILAFVADELDPIGIG